jgi:hypothetical protein
VKRADESRGLIARVILYFSALGLGYLFVELALIEKFSFYLESAPASFGIVLSCMLVFSGAGSLSASRFARAPYGGVLKALPVVAAGFAFFAFALDRLFMASAGLPVPAKVAAAVAIVAPVAFAMGRFFPLGIESAGESSVSLVPWAWAVNGAFSVISTPIAKIFSIASGWKIVFAAAFLLYISTMATFPQTAASRGPRRR